MGKSYRILGCSHGLLCLYRVGLDDPFYGTENALIWNPSIRNSVEVVVPNVANGDTYETVLGFGVCRREINDLKIVKITHIIGWSDFESASCIPWQVEVFTLSTGTWRRISGNLPQKLVHFHFDPTNACSIVIHGVIYWFATDLVTMDGGSCNLIISFDITSEEFGEVNLPNSLAHPPSGRWFSMFKLNESLVVLDDDYRADRMVYDVWLMEGGVPKSYTKLSTIKLNTHTLDTASAMGFRKSGEHIIEIVEDQRGHLAVYDPHSKHIDNLGINGSLYAFLCIRTWKHSFSMISRIV